MSWQAQLDDSALAARLGAKPDAVRDALTRLGARGLVGYDLGSQRYFHRELPFDLSLLSKLQPRLAAAQALVEANAAQVQAQKEGGATIVLVHSASSTSYRVRVLDDGARCTCPWFSKHRGERGPCKHVLAAQMVLERAEEPQR